MNVVQIIPIILGLLIFLLVILIIIFKKNKKTPILSPSSPNTPATGVNPPPAGNPTPKAKSTVFGKILRAVVSIALIVILIVFLFWAIKTVIGIGNSISNFFKPNTYSWVINTKKTKRVSIDGKYGDIYYVKKDEGISFEDSTVDFCVHNEVQEKCGEKGQKLKEGFPTDYQNLNNKFQVKSSNNETGYITITYWIKIKDKK